MDKSKITKAEEAILAGAEKVARAEELLASEAEKAAEAMKARTARLRAVPAPDDSTYGLAAEPARRFSYGPTPEPGPLGGKRRRGGGYGLAAEQPEYTLGRKDVIRSTLTAADVIDTHGIEGVRGEAARRKAEKGATRAPTDLSGKLLPLGEEDYGRPAPIPLARAPTPLGETIPVTSDPYSAFRGGGGKGGAGGGGGGGGRDGVVPVDVVRWSAGGMPGGVGGAGGAGAGKGKGRADGYDYTLGRRDIINPQKSGLSQFFEMKGAGAIGGDAGAMASASGMLKAGPMAGLAATVGIVKVGMDGLQGAMSKTAKVVEVMGNSTMTTAQKQEELAKSIPIVGGLVTSFMELRDAIKGVNEAIRQSKLAEPKLRLGQEREHAITMTQGRMAQEASPHYRRAAALRGVAANMAQAPLIPVGEGYQAQLKYQEQQALYQPQVERQKAGAEAEAARASEGDAGQRLQGLYAKGDALKKKADIFTQLREREEAAEKEKGKPPTATEAAAEAARPKSRTERLAQGVGNLAVNNPLTQGLANVATRFGATRRDRGEANALMARHMPLGGGSGDLSISANREALAAGGAERDKAGREQAGMQEQTALNAVLLNRKEIQAGILQQQEATNVAAQKESEVRKKDNEIAKSKLELLKQQIQTMQSQATRVGGMSEMEKAMGLAAARHVKQHGIKATPMEMRARAAQFAPEYMRAEQEKAGLEDPATRAAKAEGFFMQGDAKEKALEAQKVQTQVNVNVSLDEAQLSERIVQALERSFAKLVDNIKSEFQARSGQVEAGQRRAANLGAGGTRGP